MAGKGKMVTGGLTTKGPGKKATTRVQTKSEVNKTVARGNKAKLDIIPMEADLVENVRPDAGGPSQKVTHSSAAKDFRAMQAKEGDPFALKYREGTRYTHTKRDIEKGVIDDPNVFKGTDAPYGMASSQQQEAFRKADATVRTHRDPEKREEARSKMNILGQFPGVASGNSHACFGSGCSTVVKPSESVLCPSCEARDSREVQIGSPSASATSRANTRKSA
jgi:glucose/arabinose dehydrogenase